MVLGKLREDLQVQRLDRSREPRVSRSGPGGRDGRTRQAPLRRQQMRQVRERKTHLAVFAKLSNRGQVT